MPFTSLQCGITAHLTEQLYIVIQFITAGLFFLCPQIVGYEQYHITLELHQSSHTVPKPKQVQACKLVSRVML